MNVTTEELVSGHPPSLSGTSPSTSLGRSHFAHTTGNTAGINPVGPLSYAASPGAAASGDHSGFTTTRARSARFGNVSVTYLEHRNMAVSSDAYLNERDAHTIRLMVVLDGEVTLSFEEISATLKRRDSALISGIAPVAYRADQDVRIVMCDVPASLGTLSAVPRSAPFVVGRVDAAVPCALGAFLVDLLRQDASRMTPIARTQISEILKSVLTSTMTALAVEGNADWQMRKQRLSALRFIANHYANPSLSSAAVAELLGLSRRSLQRIFEDDEKTVSQHIQEMRTKNAMSRLKDQRFAAVSLKEIATLSGFGSTVAMRRSLQDYMGQTPSEIRRMATEHVTASGSGPGRQY